MYLMRMVRQPRGTSPQMMSPLMGNLQRGSAMMEMCWFMHLIYPITQDRLQMLNCAIKSQMLKFLSNSK